MANTCRDGNYDTNFFQYVLPKVDTSPHSHCPGPLFDRRQGMELALVSCSNRCCTHRPLDMHGDACTLKLQASSMHVVMGSVDLSDKDRHMFDNRLQGPELEGETHLARKRASGPITHVSLVYGFPQPQSTRRC